MLENNIKTDPKIIWEGVDWVELVVETNIGLLCAR